MQASARERERERKMYLTDDLMKPIMHKTGDMPTISQPKQTNVTSEAK